MHTSRDVTCDCCAFATGVVPEQTCQVQETRKASPEGNGSNCHTHMQRHHAKHVPRSEQGVPTLRTPQHYQHHEPVPSGKTPSSSGPT
jgi:hypothetical protein